MTKTAWIALGVPLAAGIWVSAGPAPEAEITNGRSCGCTITIKNTD